MNPIALSDEDRNDLVEIIKEYIDDLFEDYGDGVITLEELRASTTLAASRAAAMVLPDALEDAAVPFIQGAAAWLWDGLIHLGRRNPGRLARRIDKNLERGHDKRASRLREILDGLLEAAPEPAQP